jgi:hypothetical protein
VTDHPTPTPAARRLAELRAADERRRERLRRHVEDGCLGCPQCWPEPLAGPVDEVLDALRPDTERGAS